MSTVPIQNLRSGVASKRPVATGLSVGEIAINYNEVDPAIYIRGSADALVKVAPVYVATGAPNATPASGGASGNSIGEQWLDKSVTPPVQKVWDGSTWVPSFAIGSGVITNSEINASAAIAYSKLALSGSIVNADISASAAIGLSKLATGSLPSGITVASSNLVDGTIVDADINASAAIALSKLATGALPSGITVESSNIVNGTIVDADINASAGIALSKLATGALPSGITIDGANITDGSIVDADINATAAITLTKLATGALPSGITVNSSNIVNDSIVNADISPTAAISYSKLSLTGSIVDADVSASAAIADSKLATISTAGKVSGNAITAGTIGGSTAISTSGAIATTTTLAVGQSSVATNTDLDLNGAYAQTVQTVAALDIDCSTGNYFIKTINGNSTFTFSNVPSSRAYSFVIEITQTSGSITWPASVKFPADTAPTLTAGKTHLFIFVTDDGGTRWRGASLVDYVN